LDIRLRFINKSPVKAGIGLGVHAFACNRFAIDTAAHVPLASAANEESMRIGEI